MVLLDYLKKLSVRLHDEYRGFKRSFLDGY